MNILKNEELTFVNDKEKGINSCGFNVNSLLFNSGRSPIMTMNCKQNSTNDNAGPNKMSSLFNNLVVPNWMLHYDQNPSENNNNNNNNTNNTLSDNEPFEIIDDNLYDNLLDLMSLSNYNTNNRNNTNSIINNDLSEEDIDSKLKSPLVIIKPTSSSSKHTKTKTKTKNKKLHSNPKLSKPKVKYKRTRKNK